MHGLKQSTLIYSKIGACPTMSRIDIVLRACKCSNESVRHHVLRRIGGELAAMWHVQLDSLAPPIAARQEQKQRSLLQHTPATSTKEAKHEVAVPLHSNGRAAVQKADPTPSPDLQADRSAEGVHQRPVLEAQRLAKYTGCRARHQRQHTVVDARYHMDLAAQVQVIKPMLRAAPRASSLPTC